MGKSLKSSPVPSRAPSGPPPCITLTSPERAMMQPYLERIAKCTAQVQADQTVLNTIAAAIAGRSGNTTTKQWKLDLAENRLVPVQ